MSKLYNGEVNINIGDSKKLGKVVRIYTDLQPGMEVYSNEKGNVETGLKKALKLVKEGKAQLDTYSFWIETLKQKGKAVLCYHKAIKGRVQIKREDPNRVQSSTRQDI
jgi:hypothetical protein